MTKPLARKGGFAHIGADAPQRRRPPGKIIAVVGVALVVLLWWGACSTGDDHPSPTGTAPAEVPLRSSHGPATLQDGVPNGFTRDPEGAATAAVTTIQALTEASGGRIAMTAVEATRIGASPSETIREVIEDGKKPPRANAGQLTVFPAAVTVVSYSDDAAQVSVWEMTVSQYQFNETAPKAVRVNWSTEVVSLRWEGDDWRLVDKKFAPGPNPDDAAVTAPAPDSPLAGRIQEGYYSMFVN